MTAEARRFAGFFVTGGLAALVNVLSRLALSQVLRYEIAVALAYLVGMAAAYLMMRGLVFVPSSRWSGSEVARFAFVNLLALVQVWAVSVILARLAFPAIGFGWHAETVAHVIGVLSPVLTSYYGHKHVTFRTAGRRCRT